MQAKGGPRKVLVGTAMFNMFGEYPGLEARLEELGGLIDRMAAQAAEEHDGARLDLAALPEYATLKSEHARFHKEAGEVIKKADSGKSVAEEVALGAKSGFATASSNVVMAIMTMKKKVPA